MKPSDSWKVPRAAETSLQGTSHISRSSVWKTPNTALETETNNKLLITELVEETNATLASDTLWMTERKLTCGWTHLEYFWGHKRNDYMKTIESYIRRCHFLVLYKSQKKKSESASNGQKEAVLLYIEKRCPNSFQMYNHQRIITPTEVLGPVSRSSRNVFSPGKP